MRENKTCLDQGWKQMPTEELDKILQAELEKEHPDEEVVLPILNELEEREKDYPVEKTPEILMILNQFSKYETTSKQPKRRRGWLAGVAAIAAMICIVVMAVPRTVEADSLFDILFRWTESVFQFFAQEQDVDHPPMDIVFYTDNPGLQQLYDKVTELGVKDSVVPMWLPEGFELTELTISPLSGGNKIYGRFEKDNSFVTVSYVLATDITDAVEKGKTDVELFEFGGVYHFVMHNEECLTTTWMAPGLKCLLNTNLVKEDLFSIIKSIYRSDLS